MWPRRTLRENVCYVFFERLDDQLVGLSHQTQRYTRDPGLKPCVLPEVGQTNCWYSGPFLFEYESEF
ncbi:hypothetical protein HanIR_Chr09g0416621 [Helianthus annuus]|nr:hypothetical protein HanIR_Chr09g0416621 [Helianthus annuus]